MPMYVTATFLILPIFHSSLSLPSHAGMRPSSTMSFEQGLERGVPWGRDLFTFVTSAAGHMMRTLQRPRKNKPSKRQVNHRRFLHNMIQRKFAEIEAANQQLASALFSADASHTDSDTKSSHKNQSVKNLKKATNNSETPAKQQDEVNDGRTLTTLDVNSDKYLLKTKPLNHLNSAEDSQPRKGVEEIRHSLDNSPHQNTDFNCESEQIQSTSAELDNLTQVTNIILEDNIFSWLESIERIRQNSDVNMTKSCEMEQEEEYLGITLFDMSPTSPAVSPLSLDSCDFEEQTQPDSDHKSEMQHITECLQTDVMENLELLESSEGYLQSHHHDQKNIASALHMQREEELSCFQDDFTFHYTPHEGYIMDNQAVCDSGNITGGLEDGPLLATFLESSVKDLNVELNLRGNVACESSCLQNHVRYATGLKNDSYVNQPGSSTTNKKEGQCSVNGTWSMLEKNSNVLEQGYFSNHDLDIHVIQSLEHGPTNQSLTKYWKQHNVLNDNTLSKVIDPYYEITDAEKNTIEVGSTLNHNSAFATPPNALTLTTVNCYGFDIPTQANNNYKGDSCSYSNGEGNECIPSFDGVAQSFPAPVHKPHPHSVSTPPLNDDWLFSNIVAEEDFSAMVRSPECTYC